MILTQWTRRICQPYKTQSIVPADISIFGLSDAIKNQKKEKEMKCVLAEPKLILADLLIGFSNRTNREISEMVIFVLCWLDASTTRYGQYLFTAYVIARIKFEREI